MRCFTVAALACGLLSGLLGYFMILSELFAECVDDFALDVTPLAVQIVVRSKTLCFMSRSSNKCKLRRIDPRLVRHCKCPKACCCQVFVVPHPGLEAAPGRSEVLFKSSKGDCRLPEGGFHLLQQRQHQTFLDCATACAAWANCGAFDRPNIDFDDYGPCALFILGAYHGNRDHRSLCFAVVESSDGADVERRSNLLNSDSCWSPGLSKVRARLNGFEFFVRPSAHGFADLVKNGWLDIQYPEDLGDLADLGSSGTFLAIGARTAWYVLLFARKGWKVIVVEPLSSRRKVLEANLCLHPVLRDQVQVAISAIVGRNVEECVIQAPNNTIAGEDAVVCGNGPCPPGYTCSSIPTKSLDDLLAGLNLPSLDVVKLDIEDDQCGVVSGGEALLSKYKPRFIVADLGSSNCMESWGQLHGYSSRADREGKNCVLSPARKSASTSGLDHCRLSGFRLVQVRRDDFQMYVRDNGEDYMSNLLTEQGWYEIQDPEDLGDISDLGSNGTFLDIGANIGWFTLLFAGKGWRVIAVEPLPTNLQALEANLCLHPELRNRVTVVRAAIVETRGDCKIHAPSNSPGMGYLACDTMKCPEQEVCTRIQTRNLDDLLKELDLQKVDVAKSDVSGYDCSVFRGGETLFTRFSPRIVAVETNAPGVMQCIENLAKKHDYILRADRMQENTVMTSQKVSAVTVARK